MIDKQKLLETIDERIKVLRDIDEPVWMLPEVFQRIDECYWLKRCVEKMDSSTHLCQTQSAGADEAKCSVKIKTNTRPVKKNEVNDDT